MSTTTDAIRQLSCGCCTNGCCCTNHMDIPNGTPPKRCALHPLYSRAFREGMHACQMLVSYFEGCPYGLHTQERRDWQSGWHQMQQELTALWARYREPALSSLPAAPSYEEMKDLLFRLDGWRQHNERLTDDDDVGDLVPQPAWTTLCDLIGRWCVRGEHPRRVP